MKKVVAFIGSPRENGNTSAIVKEIVRGSQSKEVEAKVYILNEMDIKPCQGCFFCQKKDGCAIKDDMQSVYEDIKTADAIVIGSPIYMYNVTAQTKLLLDRLFPIIGKNGGYFVPKFGIKNTILVYSYGESNSDNFKQAFEINANLFKVLGLNILDTIISSNANDPKMAIQNKSLMTKAFKIGQELIK
jgi:multimeric flavodoxin WrbA